MIVFYISIIQNWWSHGFAFPYWISSYPVLQAVSSFKFIWSNNYRWLRNHSSTQPIILIVTWSLAKKTWFKSPFTNKNEKRKSIFIYFSRVLQILLSCNLSVIYQAAIDGDRLCGIVPVWNSIKQYLTAFIILCDWWFCNPRKLTLAVHSI